jgi:hypothetical protein
MSLSEAVIINDGIIIFFEHETFSDVLSFFSFIVLGGFMLRCLYRIGLIVVARPLPFATPISNTLLLIIVVIVDVIDVCVLIACVLLIIRITVLIIIEITVLVPPV